MSHTNAGASDKNTILTWLLCAPALPMFVHGILELGYHSDGELQPRNHREVEAELTEEE